MNVIREVFVIKKIYLLLLVPMSVSVSAWGTIEKQEVDGFNRYCYYSDGGVSTVSSSSFCPSTNSDQGSNRNSPVINKKGQSVGFGTLESHSTKGFNRYCNYSDGSIKTIKSASLCPMTSN